ncbi:MAG: hypothetical protein ABI687_13025 [Flavitalea sp.]
MKTTPSLFKAGIAAIHGRILLFGYRLYISVFIPKEEYEPLEPATVIRETILVKQHQQNYRLIAKQFILS